MKNVYSKLKGYPPKAIDHFMNPRNVGEIAGADCIVNAENPDCGDMMKLYVRVEGGVVAEVKMKAFGCTALIACASALTEMMKRKTLQECRSLDGEAVLEYLGGLPEDKKRCADTAGIAVQLVLQHFGGETK